MGDFNMTRRYNNYIDGATRLGRLRQKIEALRSGFVHAEDMYEAQERISAAEAEYDRLKAEVDDLKCLADTGVRCAELNQASSIQWKQQAGGMRAHFPQNRVQRLNH